MRHKALRHAAMVIFHTSLFGVLAALAMLIASPVRAATITVTNALDSGAGSLRQVVLDGADGDIVVFSPAMFGVPVTITLSGQIEITKSLVIDGAGEGVVTPTISGNHITRTFQVDAGVTASLFRLNIVDGEVGRFGSDQACNLSGGGIANAGNLSVSNSAFARNGYSGTLPDECGGAIYSEGTLTIVNSTFFANGGIVGLWYGLWLGGGGIFNTGLATVVNSSFVSNTVPNGRGGGIDNSGSMSVISCTFSNNWAFFEGGGIDNYGALSVASTTFLSNTAYDFAGGIGSDGTLSVTNSTFVGNSATNNVGGGIGNVGLLRLTNSTFMSNSAINGAGFSNYANRVLTVSNTLIANSLAGGNCSGTIIDGGHNLDSGNTCGFSAPGSLTNTNPLLGPLGDYGSPVPTIPLLLGSPAIDAGDDAACPATDARGVPRPSGTHCDIGAYEAAFTVRRSYMPLIQR